VSQTLGFSRRTLLQTVAFGALAGCAAGAGQVGLQSGSADVEFPVPQAPRIPFRIDQLGRVRNDPYRWMKYIPETGSRTMDSLPDMVRKHLQAEAGYAENVLKPARALQPEIRRQMQSIAPVSQEPPALPSGPWVYTNFYPDGSAHAVHVRAPVGDPAGRSVLMDEAERAAGHSYFRASDHQHSRNHRYFAWAEDVIGNDRHRICVRDLETGKISVPVPADAYGYGGMVFSPSSKWMFWIWRNEKNRPTRVFRTSLESGETVLVYEEASPTVFLQLKLTAADGYVAIVLSGPDTSEVWLVPAKDEAAAPMVVFPRRDLVRYDIDEWNGGLVVLTDEGGAIDNKLLLVSPDTFALRETLVEHRPGEQILEIMPFERALVRLERRDGLHQLILRSSDGKEKAVTFEDAAYAVQLAGRQPYTSTTVRITYQTPRQPVQWMDVDLESGKATILQSGGRAGFNTDDYVVERLFATAPDGVRVPITLLSQRNAPRDGSQPCLLYGYGAYGVSSDPVFSIAALALVARGWAYAIAHVRGGSELGRQWFLDGRRFKKRNSFTDFVACAEHLCAQNVTRKGAIVAYGLSAGGLLVGGAMNTKPEMWAGVIAQVPFVDMLNTMSDGDHPLVPLFRPDWGDPLADPVAYDYMASISPYENVQPTAYPPLLCTSGLKDDRVGYWEAAKLVAEVRFRSTGSAPAILLLDADSGHQSSGNLEAEFEEMSLFWAFAETAVAQGF
jgi:oligopeptidase B